MKVTANIKILIPIRLGICALTCIALSSCSLLGIEQTSTDSEKVADTNVTGIDTPSHTARVEIVSNQDLSSNAALSDVEVLWQIPKDPVEGFVVNYGFERESMTHKSKIYSSDLERYQDTKFGEVFRFVLANVPLDKPLYVSIAAFNGDKVSRPSDVFEVKADSGS